MISNPSFLSLSAKIGSNHLLVQGAGGNTSIKDEKIMWIKASGSWLSEAEKKEIFVAVDPVKIRFGIENFYEDPLQGVMIEKGALRPSIETTMHTLMSHKIVLHTHPVELLAWLVLINGKDKLEKLLRGESFTWVDYARPGLELTHAIRGAIEDKQVDVLLLGNHGLVVGGVDCDAASKLMDRIMKYCRKLPRKCISPNRKELKMICNRYRMRPARYEIVHSLALDDMAYKYCNDKNGILYPDQAVFLGPQMPCYDEATNEQQLDLYLEENNSRPFIIIKGKGVLVSEGANTDVDEMLRCHAEVLMRIDDNEKLRYLTDNEVARLLDWEPEKYRQTIN